MRTVLLVALALGPALPAVAAPLPAQAIADAYVDLIDHPRPQTHWRAFWELRQRLQAGFDAICPDTICEGAYSDYQALRLRCSVAAATGYVAECGWAFAASEVEVDPGSGALLADQPTWLCRLPVPTGTTVDALLQGWSGPRAIHQRLPGAEESVFEALGDCLGR